MPMSKREVNALLVAERKKGRAKVTTKGEIQKLMVEERKKSRIAHRESRFKQRTLDIYNGQVRRAKELNKTVDYTLEDFREHVRKQLEDPCPYCGVRLTVNGFTDDHPDSIARGGAFTLVNTAACCKPCNFRKGMLNRDEFQWLSRALAVNLPPEAVSDVWRRLALGGKWVGKLLG